MKFVFVCFLTKAILFLCLSCTEIFMSTVLSWTVLYFAQTKRPQTVFCAKITILCHYFSLSGFYCPEGTGYDQQPCPTGTFSPLTLLSSPSECLPCLAGQYCNSINTSTTTGPCEAGFYCHNGSDTATPSGQSKGSAGICPPGSYCEAGDPKAPVACQAGTFNNRTHGQNISDCTKCVSGYYCGSSGLVYPTGKCDQGFYCRQGSSASNPSLSTYDHGPCPVGHFCPEGTGNPYKCPVGTHNPLEQQWECVTCPPGHYCDEGAVNSTECPAGYYCPNG